MNKTINNHVSINIVRIDDESYLKITNCDAMRPFFMSIVSHSDHWMFISSNGGLTAGRKNADNALFPYYTDDKITEMSELTGSKTVLSVSKNDEVFNWEPMSDRNIGQYAIRRNLYKSIYGNKILFEEVNEDLGLVYSYKWSSSDRYGFIKDVSLKNMSSIPLQINVLDGIQNILPFGVNSDLQNASSNLVDAYKRCELHDATGLGIYTLSAIIVDKAEPSEALKANIVWSSGLEADKYLLSSAQVDNFRIHNSVSQESDIKGEKGAYFINSIISLDSNTIKSWRFIADVNKSRSQITKIINDILRSDDLFEDIDADINAGTQNLKHLISAADGIQFTNDRYQDIRHYSNVLFNIMRGGIFDNGYNIEKDDFLNYIETANCDVFEEYNAKIGHLNAVFNQSELLSFSNMTNDRDLIRLSKEYLPLKFSRRHGDPSRPWNRFSINIKNERDGSKVLDYEGNWRDIFQNWEALAYSYPEFIESMIYKFLNASTFDGYNPYRVTKDGFDWETIEPDDPWSYIGYWGDHQIIYLQKFLEIIERYKPERLMTLMREEDFVYASVPYIIKPYDEVVNNPKDTIIFDENWDKHIRERRDNLGADGALLTDSKGEIYHVNFIEKIMASLLAKLINFIPEGGIWMNTQRPEWNDANNALVGNGVSMVTLYYLRRMLFFIKKILEQTDITSIQLSNELVELYHSVREIFDQNEHLLSRNIDDRKRKDILDELGKVGSDYRTHIYDSGFWGKKRTISKEGLIRFFKLSLKFIDHTIDRGKRSDNLFHTYNLMSYSEAGVTITHLDEMLEGQVAVLSSGYLDAPDVLKVMEALKASALFRPDQYSYILYPDKDLPGFLEKNNIDKSDAESSILIQTLVNDENSDIVEKSINGQYHFNGNFKNANDLDTALDSIAGKGYGDLVDAERSKLLVIFEKVFNHKAFTGRSGTFFAYEGLGSIYWHMVSKLVLAFQECCVKALLKGVSPQITGKMLDHYYEAQAGIGVHKSPDLYGAFPTDPYSHTPKHKGAQQPGMTGQVKEDILSRLVELGITVNEGCLSFNPILLKRDEFLDENTRVKFITLNKNEETFDLEKGQLFFSYCQVPIIYTVSSDDRILVTFKDNNKLALESNKLDFDTSQSLFARSNKIKLINVFIDQKKLK